MWQKNGCSIYLWAHRLEDVGPNGFRLGVIPGKGFNSKVTQVHTNVQSFDDAVARLKSLPVEKKNVFYSWDSEAGILVSCSGNAAFVRRPDLFAFFWGE